MHHPHPLLSLLLLREYSQLAMAILRGNIVENLNFYSVPRCILSLERGRLKNYNTNSAYIPDRTCNLCAKLNVNDMRTLGFIWARYIMIILTSVMRDT